MLPCLQAVDFPVWVQDCWFGMFLCYSHVHTHTCTHTHTHTQTHTHTHTHTYAHTLTHTHAHIHTYQVASKLSALRQREGDINSLHRQLQTITRTLGEARDLLEAKQQVLDVGKFLSRCKVREELTELRLTVLACTVLMHGWLLAAYSAALCGLFYVVKFMLIGASHKLAYEPAREPLYYRSWWMQSESIH